MGSGNLGYCMKVPGLVPTAICDVYQPHLERADAAARRGGLQPKSVKDFREILADKSIDAVCISTPDHWHAYMTVEACKAGKDVYVEKPACVYIEEGRRMVEAARKYDRVVQAGTMQRSGGYFKKAAELVKSGALGDITFCHAFQSGLTSKAGYGNPPTAPPPPTSIGICGWDPRPRSPSTPTVGASRPLPFPPSATSGIMRVAR
jgi:predicted dehydrogenase